MRPPLLEVFLNHTVSFHKNSGFPLSSFGKTFILIVETRLFPSMLWGSLISASPYLSTLVFFSPFYCWAILRTPIAIPLGYFFPKIALRSLVFLINLLFFFLTHEEISSSFFSMACVPPVLAVLPSYSWFP